MSKLLWATSFLYILGKRFFFKQIYLCVCSFHNSPCILRGTVISCTYSAFHVSVSACTVVVLSHGWFCPPLVIPPHPDVWQSRVIFVCPRWGGWRDAAGIRWLAARDAAEQPAAHRVVPTTKIPVTLRLRKPGGRVFYFYYWQLCGICVISILYKRSRDVFRSWKS